MIRPAEAYGAFNERKAYEPKIIPKDLLMAREHRIRLIEVMVISDGSGGVSQHMSNRLTAETNLSTHDVSKRPVTSG